MKFGTAVTVTLTDYERAQILPHCKSAMVGGSSYIFKSKEKRLEELQENQLVGLTSEAAFCKWAEPLGSGGIESWLRQRSRMNLDKFTGDAGFDCELASGIRIDVKSSEPKGVCDEFSVLNYHLTQDRKKTFPHVAYVQCFAKTQSDAYQVPKEVLVVGWLWGQELLGREDSKKLMGGGLEGYSVRCSSIRDIQELRNVSGSGMKLSNEA